MKKILLILTTILAISASADAKWWIFGKSNDEVGLKYLQINKIPVDETGAKIKLFKETLGPDGTLKFSGKASVGKSAVGSIRISLDDKATWKDLKFSDNGAFEYQFKPETGRTYVMYLEITDTAGKTNKVEETRKELTLSEENIQAKVRETLDALFASYNSENLSAFMAGVGENFAGDKAILERAVKRDFDALSNIAMRYAINNVAAGSQGRVFVSITYNRMVFVNKSGASSQDTGITEFVFDSKEGKLALYSMKQPLVFGLSDASNVATGEVAGNTASNLVLDETGDLGGGMQTVTHTCYGTFPSYRFSTGEKSCGPGLDVWFYDWTSGIGYSSPTQSKGFNKSLYSLTSAEVKDLAGYAAAGSIAVVTGNAYCFHLNAEFYCVEPVSMPSAGDETVTFKVKKF